MHMNITNLVKILGRSAIISDLGVSQQSISNAIASGAFPPAWFDVLDKLAREKGFEGAPRALFNFKQITSAPMNTLPNC